MERTQEILSEVRILADKTARIETHIEYQAKQNDRIEKALVALEETKAKVERHETKLTAFTWVFGVIVSLFSTKLFGYWG